MSSFEERKAGTLAQRRPAAWMRLAALFTTAALTAWMAGLVMSAEPQTQPARLQFEPRFILEAVALEMGVKLRPEIPVPEILFESTTPLRRFQDAMSRQWSFTPHAFANAYSPERNEIYLTDTAAYYGRHGRTLDDSLAHEFAHYIQVHYLGADAADLSLEDQAIAVQERFRLAYSRAITALARTAVCSPAPCMD